MSAVTTALFVLVLATSPWKVGDEIAGWEVDQVAVHPEYQRLSMRRGAERIWVEVTYRRETDSPWESRHYRVQPAPGQRAERPLLRAMLSHLKSLEQDDQHRPFVSLMGGTRQWTARLTTETLFSLLWALLLTAPWLGLIWLARRPLQRGYATWLRITGPWFSVPIPPGPPSKEPWKDNAILALGAGLVGAGFLLLASAPPPLYSDTCIDLALARDCLQGDCRYMGIGSSFQGLRHGGTWSLFLAWVLHQDLTSDGAHLIISLSHGMAAALFAWSFCSLMRREIAIPAALLVMLLAVRSVEYPALWTPSLAPLGLALWLTGMTGLLRSGGWSSGLLVLLGLVLATESHLINWLLLLPTAALLGLDARRPLWPLFLGTLGVLFLWLLLSRGTLAWNASLIAGRGRAVLVFWLPLAAFCLGLCLRQTFRGTAAAVASTLLAFTALLLLPLFPVFWERRVMGEPMHMRYLLPIIPLVGFLVALAANRMTSRPLVGWGIRIALAMLVLHQGVHAWRIFNQPRTYYTLADAEALARGSLRDLPFPEMVARLRGPQHRDLLRCLGALGSRPTEETEPLKAHVKAPQTQAPQTKARHSEAFHTHGSALYLALEGDRPVPVTARRIPLPLGRAAALWELRTWIRQAPTEGRPTTRYGPTFLHRVSALVSSEPLTDVRLRISITGSDGARQVRLLPEHGPWEILRVEGVSHRIAKSRREVLVIAGPQREGILHLRLTVSTRHLEPPDFLEMPATPFTP